MNRHEHLKELLARRAELSPREEARLQEHLRGCSYCRQTADAYARQAALLRSLPLVEPPPALRARVLNSLQQPNPSVPFRRRRPLFLLSPVAVVLVFVGATLAYLHFPQPATHTASAPQATAAPFGPLRHARTPRTQLAPKQAAARQSHPTSKARAGHGRRRSSLPSALQTLPSPTLVPFAAAPIVSQRQPATPTSSAGPSSSATRRAAASRARPVRAAAIPTATPTPVPSPPGVALSSTPPGIRALPVTHAPAPQPTVPVGAASTIPTSTPTPTPSPASPSPVYVAGPESATPTPTPTPSPTP